MRILHYELKKLFSYKSFLFIIAAVLVMSIVSTLWDINANNLSVIGIYPAKKSNRVFRTKHFALMRKFRARGRPSLNDRHRLFQT